MSQQACEAVEVRGERASNSSMEDDGRRETPAGWL